eukprot:3090917-Amphidinium_carterae.1
MWIAMPVVKMQAFRVGLSALRDKAADRDTSIAEVIVDSLGTAAASASLLRARSPKRTVEGGLYFLPLLKETYQHASP